MSQSVGIAERWGSVATVFGVTWTLKLSSWIDGIVARMFWLVVAAMLYFFGGSRHELWAAVEWY
ncbi:MAG TPA: hypothetical protein PK263_07000 [bacterium]|nr:hypothetical protein [bacterium]